jgi:DNA-directed RNA polymerase subunit E'/Rpb7
MAFKKLNIKSSTPTATAPTVVPEPDAIPTVVPEPDAIPTVVPEPDADEPTVFADAPTFPTSPAVYEMNNKELGVVNIEDENLEEGEIFEGDENLEEGEIFEGDENLEEGEIFEGEDKVAEDEVAEDEVATVESVISKKGRREFESNHNIYSKSVLSRKLCIPITQYGRDLISIFQKRLIVEIEGKCIEEGYIKPRSTQILSYSSGMVRDSNIIVNLIFECSVCHPVEGMLIACVIKNITKAGIRCEIDLQKSYHESPVIIFLAKEHNYKLELYNDVNEGEHIQIKVIGQRYELNDKFISILGTLVRRSSSKSNKN